jgi:hypothetical protein
VLQTTHHLAGDKSTKAGQVRWQRNHDDAKQTSLVASYNEQVMGPAGKHSLTTVSRVHLRFGASACATADVQGAKTTDTDLPGQ